MAAWKSVHGAKVVAVGTALDRTQDATKQGEPVGIRSSCETLRDAVTEAKTTPAVPDAAAESALRKALDSTATGVSDCVRAMATGDARLLEKSISELRQARLDLDTANARLNPD